MGGQPIAVPAWCARWLPRVVLVAQVLVAIAFGRTWLTAGTYQLYLDDRADVGSSSEARQRFVVQGSRVVPQILTRGAERFRFRVPASRPARLHFRARPEGPATIDVRWSGTATTRVLGRRVLAGVEEVSYRLPATGGVLDLTSQGSVTWSDLRIVEAFPWPQATALVFLLALGWALPRSHAAFTVEWSAWERFLLVRTAAVLATALVLVVTLEAALRVAAWASPTWMAVERSRLGEVAPDPYWTDSPRYGRVPRPHRDATGEWTLGDIVRMGFVPPAVSPALLHRFPVRTDGEGFRNDSAIPERLDVAALGDSFTDALTLPVELSWPGRLEARLGRRVRNYGVAGFGPQQELRVLRDLVLPRRPRVVVVAFFAGNDIPGAALFDEFERSGASGSFGVSGWPFKRTVAHFDRSYAFLLTRRLLATQAHAAAPEQGAAGRRHDAAFSGVDETAPAVRRASFDRGMFALPIGGRTLRFALMPSYLNLLNLGRAEIEAHPGWDVTRRSLSEMDRACRAAGARLVVMFVPSKSQVYFPLLVQAFSRASLRRALELSLPRDPWGVDVQRLTRNRLVQNELVGEFCRRTGIPFVDLTPDLEREASRGENVYFPDDSHWNARGHRVAAERLVAHPFLQSGTEGAPRKRKK